MIDFDIKMISQSYHYTSLSVNFIDNFL